MALKSMVEPVGLAEDMLVGGEAIAVFMFGDKSHRKKVFNFAENRALPIFRLGRSIYARKSTLLAWIEEQEAAKPATLTASRPPPRGQRRGRR